MKRFLFAGLLMWMLPHLAAEESLWSQAEGFYGEGQFELALKSYESLKFQEGTSAALEYNLGNTLMRLNRIPEAMAHYRRAQWTSPHDPDIQANLSRVQSLQNAHVPDLPLTRRAAGILPATAWSLLLLLSAWALGLTGIMRKKMPILKLAWVWILPAAVFVLLVSGGSLLLLQPDALATEAVARPETLTSRFEPLESATEHFSVTGASVVEVLEEVRGWTRIRVDGKSGWVLSSELIPVGSPDRQG